MEWWSTIAGLARRKQVLVPAVLAAVALGIVAYLLTPARYVSSATMVLTTTEFGGSESQDPSRPTELTNPMLNFNDSLTTTSAILIEAMNTKSVATDLGVRGPDRLIVDDGRTNPNLLGLNGPFLYVVGQSTSPRQAERIVLGAQRLMREKLLDWQSSLNAPERTYVSLVDVVPPTHPATDRTRALKLGLSASLLGFALSMGIAYLRHRRRSAGGSDTPSQPRIPRWLVVSGPAEQEPDPPEDPAPDEAGDDEPQAAPGSLAAGAAKP